jgi:hypothetical protein
MIIDHFYTDYHNQNRDLLTKYHSRIIRVAKANIKGSLDYQSIDQLDWERQLTKKELYQISEIRFSPGYYKVGG